MTIRRVTSPDVPEPPPERPVSTHRNLVTAEGLAAIERELKRLDAAHAAAVTANDTAATALIQRDLRYWSARRASAQVVAPPADKPEMRTNCPGLVAERPMVVPAAFRLAALESDQVRLTYVGHATFLIESPQLVRIATDYNSYVRPNVLPDIVTMNHAHSSHYTDNPEAGIKHVLRGWLGDEKPARIDLTYKDVRVRNVPTNIRTWSGDTERHGNSIFIFEIASLCIAHLGHLHHTLTQAQLDEIGRVDVVMVPVDGSYTLDLDGFEVATDHEGNFFENFQAGVPASNVLIRCENLVLDCHMRLTVLGF